jgi:tetratricopeptide (TPR) repeat protein
MSAVWASWFFAAQILFAAQGQKPEDPREIERSAELQVKSQPSAANWQRLGLARYLQNHFESAIPAFQQATRSDPALWPSHLFLGISQYRTNAFPESLQSLQTARRLAPATAKGSDDIDYWMGATLLALKRPWDALRSLEDLTSRNPAHKDGLAMLARAYADLAGVVWNDVAERSFGTPAGLEIHGHALESEGNVAGALAAYREAKAAKPDRAGPGLAIGKLLLRQGKTEEAIAVLSAERMLTGFDPETWFISGLASLQANRPAEALPMLQSASQWNRTDAEVPLALAQVYLSLGKIPDAVAAARKAAELDPESAAAREMLSLASSSGDRQPAASSPR